MRRILLTLLCLSAFAMEAKTRHLKKKHVPAKPAAHKSSARTKTGGKHTKRGRAKGPVKTAQTWRNRQQSPSPERFREIQEALLAKGYLKSTPSGVWDQESAAALRRFQEEQNLDPTGKVNSLSLIALGLGPRTEASARAPALP